MVTVISNHQLSNIINRLFAQCIHYRYPMLCFRETSKIDYLLSDTEREVLFSQREKTILLTFLHTDETLSKSKTEVEYIQKLISHGVRKYIGAHIPMFRQFRSHSDIQRLI